VRCAGHNRRVVGQSAPWDGTHAIFVGAWDRRLVESRFTFAEVKDKLGSILREPGACGLAPPHRLAAAKVLSLSFFYVELFRGPE
jgi:hypothetical protein